MNNRREKEQLAQVLTAIYKGAKGNPEFMELVKKACKMYRDIYVAPLIAGTGDKLPTMYFQEKNDDGLTRGFYAAVDNVVHINLARIINTRTGKKVERAFEAMRCVGHEYRHCFQWAYARALLGNDFAPFYKTMLGADADKIAQSYLDINYSKALYGKDDESRTLFALYPELYKEIKEIFRGRDFEKVLELCDYAIYFETEIEKDARKTEKQIFRTFLADMKELIGYSSVYDFLELMRLNDETEETGQRMQNGPIAKKINEAYSRMSCEDIKKFGDSLYRLRFKGNMEYKGGYGSRKKLDEFEEKKKMFAKIIKLYACKCYSYDDKSKKKKSLEELRKLFLKNGLIFAADIFTEQDLLTDYQLEDYYLDMLENEDVTKDSFEGVEACPVQDINRLLVTFVKQGKSEYVDAILKNVPQKTLEKIFAWSTNSYRKKMDRGEVMRVGAGYKEIASNNLLRALQERYITLNNKQKNKSLLFDDVDDMIKMFASFCKVFKLDYSSLKVSVEGNEMEREYKLTLLDLYRKAEELGLKQATLMRGYQPLPEDYGYAKAGDRKPYLLGEEQRNERIRRIYGENELSRVKTEKQLVQEVLDEEKLDL